MDIKQENSSPEIDVLNLDVKAYNALKRAGINTIADIESQTEQLESTIPPKHWKSITNALNAYKGIPIPGSWVEKDMLGDELTFDEITNMVGELIVMDLSTESHEWYKVEKVEEIVNGADGKRHLRTYDGSKQRGSVNEIFFDKNQHRPQRAWRLKQPSDFPCDNCGYDEKGCCNYPETPDNFCVMGDKQVPVTKKHTEISDKYAEAVQLNAHIITSARAAQQNLYDMAVGFKKMRDDKLYKELGYDNFGDYCEAETGMKRRSVYGYISVVENLPSDFVQSTAQIGKEKLYLLSTVEESQRTEIVEKTDLESTTVRELKKQIEQLKKSEENSKAELAQVKEELESSKDEISEAEERAQYAESRLKSKSETITNLSAMNATLEKRVKELESRPIDVAVDVDEVNRRVEEVLQKVNSENAHLLAEERSEFAKTINAKDDKIWELEDKLKALEDKPQKYVKKIFAFAMTMDTYSKLIELIKKSKDTDLLKALSGAKIIDLNGKEV